MRALTAASDWIYDYDRNNTVRYTLGRRGIKTLYCFGINPSTATPEKLDPTVNRVRQVAEGNHYDGWIMFNVYPKRATIFQQLHPYRDDEIHLKNVEMIGKYVREDRNRSIDIWCAWGNLLLGKPYLSGCFSDILCAIEKERETRWLCAGVNQNGTPKHPLYLRKDTKLIRFDMEAHTRKFLV